MSRGPTTSQIVRQTTQAIFLSLLSNLLAQLITLSQSTHHQALNFRSFFEFAVFAALNTPPNILWQAFLEDTFPAYTSRSKVVHYQRSTHAEDFSDLKEPSPLETEEGEEERKAAKDELERWEESKGDWTEEVQTETR